MTLSKAVKRAVRMRLLSALGKRSVGISRIPRVLLENRDWMLIPNIDYILAHYLLKKDDPSDVQFIQIGAFDGLSGDPIHKYIQRFGWKGVLVEPQQRYFDKLVANYSGCKGLKFIRAAVASKKEERILYTISDPDAPDLPKWAPQWASFSLDKIMRNSRYVDNLGGHIKEERIQCITFDDLLVEAGADRVDLIQIDVEGYDYEILKTIDFSRIHPDIVRYEHRHLSRGDETAALSLLGNAGFHLFRETFDTTAYRTETAT